MLRYKNSLLERILLEKGGFLTIDIGSAQSTDFVPYRYRCASRAAAEDRSAGRLCQGKSHASQVRWNSPCAKTSRWHRLQVRGFRHVPTRGCIWCLIASVPGHTLISCVHAVARQVTWLWLPECHVACRRRLAGNGSSPAAATTTDLQQSDLIAGDQHAADRTH